MPQAKPEQVEGATPLKLLKVNQLPKGDLYLKFNIKFPKSLSNASRLSIIKSLKDNENEL